MRAGVTFDLPKDAIFPVRDVRVALDPAPHPFETANAAAIAGHWQRASADNPALFDGPVALLSALALDGDALVGRCHIVRYSSFLYWRSVRPVDGIGHVFTQAIPVASDGALVAIRMGARTTNAGRVYFAAGSFEPADFRGGFADPEFNMRREVSEETGIDLTGVRSEPHYHAVSLTVGTVLFRRYFFSETAETLAARIRAHVAAQEEPEIEGPVIIRGAGDLPDGLAPQMPPMMRWHFGRGE